MAEGDVNSDEYKTFLKVRKETEERVVDECTEIEIFPL
jgi:hypothetical protein